MSFAERIRDPELALNPSSDSSYWWWLLFAAAILALVAIAIFRPQWLARIGVRVNLAGAGRAVGVVANPYGWV